MSSTDPYGAPQQPQQVPYGQAPSYGKVPVATQPYFGAPGPYQGAPAPFPGGPGPGGYGLSSKSFLVTWLLSLLVGVLGVDRFYLGKVGTGLLKLFTFGGMGIWALVDLILVLTNKQRDKQGLPLEGYDKHRKVALIVTGVVILLGVIFNPTRGASARVPAPPAGAPAVEAPAAPGVPAHTAGTPNSAQTPTITQKAVGLTLPDYKGKTLDVAVDELTEAGVLYEANDAVNGKVVILPKNWTIDSYTPAAGAAVRTGDKVTFQVHKPQKVSTPAAAPASSTPAADPTAEAEKTTSTGLQAVSAEIACDMYGENEFRYGYKPHWLVGRLATRIENDKWFLKVEADVTNAYNAEAAVNVECVVGGTDDLPVVESFISY
jgi:hypothetical protein